MLGRSPENMNIPFHMTSAYKYLTCATLKLIAENQTLRFTRADALNDLYELSPFLLPLNWDELTELSKTNLPAARAVANQAFQKICSSLYLTCFSRSYSTPQAELMWVHYANNHTGVCIEVDFEMIRRNEPESRYCPVGINYVDSLLDERNRRSPNSEDLPLFIATTKSRIWEYEDEVRVVMEEESLDSALYTKSDDEKSIDVAFDPKSISKVIFGLRCNPKDIFEVTMQFRSLGLSPTLVRLDIEPLTLRVVEKPLPSLSSDGTEQEQTK